MRYFFIGGIFLLLLAGRVFILEQQLADETLPQYVGTTAVVEGRVVNDPEERSTALYVYVAASQANGEAARGVALVHLPRETDLSYGDRVVVRGLIEEPESFETDAGRVFDYPGYLRVRGVSTLIRHATLVESAPGGVSLRGTLYALKHTFERSLERILPEPQVSLLEGLLLGERRGLPEALTMAFVIAGLIHIVVLSGYNISIVAESALRLLGAVMPRAAALWSGGVAIILFALLVGGGAATVRALLMGLIALLARYLERPTLALRSLGVAGAAMALWNPLVLLYDPGFVLSVVATFGLITLAPAVERYVQFVPSYKRFDLRSIVASTIAVQIFVLPALLYFTGILSFVALPANALALPAVPFAMLAGFAAGALGLIHPMLAYVPALVADLLLRWIAGVASVAATLPSASITIPAFPAWVALLVYAPLTFAALRIYSRPQTN